MTDSPKKSRTPRSKAARPPLPSLDEHLKALLNPGLLKEAQGFGEAPQAAFDTGLVTGLDPDLARKLGVPVAGGGAAMEGKAVKRKPKAPTPEEELDPDGLDKLGGSAGTIKALTALLESGDPRFVGKPIWAPHRPVRPEKSEGGIRFDLVSEY